VRTPSDAKKRSKRRVKRGATGVPEGEDVAQLNEFNTHTIILSDELEALPGLAIRCAARVRSVSFDPTVLPQHSNHASSATKGSNTKNSRLLIGLSNNTLEVYQVPINASTEQLTASVKLSLVDLHGHQ
jgi:hypothetical protein